MGLDTTHDCWHGAYSAFNRWRAELARVSGVPLDLMEGFYDPSPDSYDMNLSKIAKFLGSTPLDFCGSALLRYAAFLPIRWDILKPDVLYVLLDHSDCDGDIPADQCEPLANRLEELLPLLHGDGGGHVGDYRQTTERFIKGLRLAASLGEAVEFG